MLHVSVAGQVDIALASRQIGDRSTQPVDTGGQVERGIAQVQAQRRQHLVVAGPTEMQAPAGGADVRRSGATRAPCVHPRLRG